MNDYPRSEDEQMRELFNDAVSDVEPHDSLDSIRARTAATPFRSRRSWILGAGAAVVATAATVAAVAVMGGDPGTTRAQDPGFAGSSPTSTAPGDRATRLAPDVAVTVPDKAETPQEKAPATDGSSDEPTVPSTVEKSAVPVYYVGATSHGPRLYREFHALPSSSEDPGVAVGNALSEALAGTAYDSDYGTDWPSGTTAQLGDDAGEHGSWTVRLSNPDVDLRQRPAGMTESQAQLAVEQLIYTLQGAAHDAARSPVQFSVEGAGADGSRTDSLLGVPASDPLEAGDPASVLAQVWVIDPPEGAVLSAPFTVSGLAAAFEANVQWELMQGDEVVKRGYTTAKECCTMAPYSFTVRNVPSGEYTLRVHDEDASGGAEGAGPWTDTKNITVR